MAGVGSKLLKHHVTANATVYCVLCLEMSSGFRLTWSNAAVMGLQECHKAIREDPSPPPKEDFAPDKSYKNAVS